MTPDISEALHNVLFFRNIYDASSVTKSDISTETKLDEKHLEREILMVIRGTTNYSYCKHKLTLNRGDALFIDSWEPHQCGYTSTQTDCLHLWIHLHSKRLLANTIEYRNSVRIREPFMELPVDLLSVLNRRWEAAIKSRGHKSYATEYYQSIIRLLQEELLWNALEPRANADHNNLVKQLENILSVNYGHKVTLAELAKRFGRDQAYLSRLFKKTHGITIGEYIDKNRENYTEAALARGMTQKEIAAQLGFSSASAFWLWRKRRNDPPHTN